MNELLEPNFNSLPPVNDWDMVYLALQQANEKFFRSATAKDFGKQIIGDVAIQGADFEDLPIATSAAPVLLPIPEAEMKFGFLANGTYTQPNGPNLVYTDVQWGLTLFDGTRWVKKFTLTLPKAKDGKDGKTSEPFNVAKADGYPTGDTVYFGENKIYSALVNVPMGESPLTHPAKWKLELNGSTNPGSGTYIKAYEMSFVKNEYFQWWLIDEVNGVSFKKLIFHQGNQVFIDSFGAVVQLDIDPAYFYNFKFTVKLTSANQEIFVPVSTQASNYDMLIDWGDGIKSTFRGTGNFKSCKHTYTGIVGSEFQISISGTCPRLSFGNINAFDRQTLISIDNNTLQDTMLMISFDNCINLKRICANALSNHSPDTPINLNFTGCTNFEEVESGFGEYLQGKNVTGVSFGNTSLNSLDDSFFKYIDGLTTCANMFAGTSISKVPTTLRRSLTNISSIFYMFSGIKVPINIPSNLYDLVSGGKITDARNAFAGTSVTPIQVTGDAKALYDVLLIKSAQGVLSGGCFSYNQMSNKNQVPTAWGGTLV